MADYERRKQLYAVERADRSRRAGAVAALLAAVAGVGVGLATAAFGAAAIVAVQVGVAAAAVVMAVAAVRFYRTPPEVESLREDARAERHTARSLDRLVRAGYTVLHDRALPESGANIDHLILGPSGAWLVESDSHRSAVRQNQGGQLWAGKAPLRPVLNLVRWLAEEATRSLSAELPGWDLEVQPVVAFARADVAGGLAVVDGFIVLLPSGGVADYVLASGVVIKPLDVALLVDVAERVFPPYEVSAPPPAPPTLSRLRGLLRR